MNKKALGMSLMGTLFIFCSCVDNAYDLNKGIETDVEISGNKLPIPLGSLKAFMLDSLVKDIDIIETTEDGDYCIKFNGTMHEEKHMSPMDIKIGSTSINVEVAVPTNNPNTRNGGTVSLPVPFNIEKSVSFNNQVSRLFDRIYACSFKEDLQVKIDLKLEGLETLQTHDANLDFTINFPEFFNGLKSYDEDVKVLKENSIHITKEYDVQSNQGLTIELYCSEFNFEKEKQDGLELETNEYGVGFLSHQSKMSAEGQITLLCDAAGLSTSGTYPKVAMDLDFSFGVASIQIVDGVFCDEFHKVDSVFALDLDDIRETLEDPNINITLASPHIEVVLDNYISSPIKHVELELLGKDQEGETIPNTVINEKFAIKSATYDESTKTIIKETTNLLLTSDKSFSIEGFETIETPALETWFEPIPHFIGFSVHPLLSNLERAHVKIDQPLRMDATYNAVVPLSFKELQFSYCDTIPFSVDDESFEEVEQISNIGLKLRMTISNTIPAGISLITTALDHNNNPIEDITISPIEFEPCNEPYCTLQNTKNTKRVEIAIESKSAGFPKFEHLKFEFEVYSKDNTIGLNKAQGILISDIAIELSGDIKANLSE